MGVRPPCPSVKRVSGVIVLTSTVVWLVWALATNGWSLNRAFNTCVGQDEEELIDLRRVVAETLNMSTIGWASTAAVRTWVGLVKRPRLLMCRDGRNAALQSAT